MIVWMTIFLNETIVNCDLVILLLLKLTVICLKRKFSNPTVTTSLK